MASLDEDDWPALGVALAAALGAEREHLWRRAVFSEPQLVQWRYGATLLARARALLAAAAVRPPPEFPGVHVRGSLHKWVLWHAGVRHRGSAPSAREAALARDEEMRRLGVDKKHLTFSYDNQLPVLNQARVPRGTAGVNFELHAAAKLPPARSLDCQNPHGCPNRAKCWYRAQLALCKLWCAAAQGARNRPTLTCGPRATAASMRRTQPILARTARRRRRRGGRLGPRAAPGACVLTTSQKTKRRRRWTRTTRTTRRSASRARQSAPACSAT